MKKLDIKVKQTAGVIDTNFDDIKEQLSAQMEVYKNLEVTEENRLERKKDIATLRKIKTALNSKRIEIKKEFMSPVTEFEGKVKELTALIDEPIELIDTQVKEFEEKQKEEKKEEIKKLYKELIGEVEEYLPLEKIYDNKWENVSKSMKSITEEMTEAISSVEMAVNTIKGMSSDAVPKALEQFKDDLSLANAIAHINAHEQLKAEIIAKQKAEEERKQREEEERKKKAEEERIREEERQRLANEERIREEERQKVLEEERQKALEEEKQKEEDVEVVVVDEDEMPFEMEEPFEIEELFIARTSFTIYDQEAIPKVEEFIQSLGVTYERSDY